MIVFVCALSAVAQTPQVEPQPTASEEIIVTGERLPRTLRDTASSVAVFDSTQIEAGAGIDRLEQLLELVPNVQLGSGSLGPTIRGQDTTGAMRDLPAFLGGTRPRTTLVVDGRAVSFNEFIFGATALWDIQRVEVFRTPQTTTQGRNSIAGAIFVHSADPADDWEARGRGIVGDLRTRQLSATVSGPLLGERLAFRLSGDWRKARPSSEIVDRMRGADPDKDEYGLLRFKLVAEPAAGARMALVYAHSGSQAPQIEGVRRPFRERRDPLDGYGIFRTNVDSVTATVDFEPFSALASRTVLSLGNAKARRFAPPGLGETTIKQWDWSAETVFDWKPTTTVQLTGGLSYSHASLDQRIDLSQLSGLGVFDDTQKSLGLFGEATLRPTDRLKLTAGVRYQGDSQDRTGTLAGSIASIPLDYDRTFDAWLPKASLSYELGPALTAGVLVQRAYNPGGATLRFDTGGSDEFKAESLWNYELFVRASPASGVNVRANVFRTDIRNAQRSRSIAIRAPSGAPVGFADLFNVAEARSSGAEVELDWQVTANLAARASMGLLDTKIIDEGDGPPTLRGKQFQRSPHFSGAIAVDWRPTDDLRLSGQMRHRGSYFSGDDNNALEKVGPATVIDARAEWRWGRLSLFGYARNLLDNFYMNYLGTVSAAVPQLGTAGDARELGVGLEARF